MVTDAPRFGSRAPLMGLLAVLSAAPLAAAQQGDGHLDGLQPGGPQAKTSLTSADASATAARGPSPHGAVGPLAQAAEPVASPERAAAPAQAAASTSPSPSGSGAALPEGLKLTSDLRLRVEHDWGSRKSDGTYRDDRSRARFRLRFGLSYAPNSWATFGFRLRTGDPNNQQSSALTFGGAATDFGLYPIGVEKVWLQLAKPYGKIWFGKNAYPFLTLDDLFWGDNVFPDGVAGSLNKRFEGGALSGIDVVGAYFIEESSGGRFVDDSSFEGLQVAAHFVGGALTLAPAVYNFHQLPDLPDGVGTYTHEYTFMHVLLEGVLPTELGVKLGFETYENLRDLSAQEGVDPDLADQTSGYIASVKVGGLDNKGDWTVHVYGAWLEKYGAVDYLTQSDWARWDYSGLGTPAGRLTNMKGVELRVGYAIDKRFNLVFRGYRVAQILPEGGGFTETGNRARLDLNVGF